MNIDYGALLPFLVGPLVYRYLKSPTYSDHSKRRMIAIALGAFLMGMFAPLKALSVLGRLVLAGVGVYLIVLRDVKSLEEAPLMIDDPARRKNP